MVTYGISTISLGIQIVVLGLLIGGYFLKSQKKYRQHGILMLSAVVLHIISILVVMVPSFAAFFGDASMVNFADILVITTLIHVSAGLLAALLGVWLVSSWHLQTSLQTCFKKKRVMDVTLGLWLLAIVLGVVLYLAIIQAI
jgi:uncharacterized membrane protein YozB (DUF420 family)